ncbi:MAG: nucleotidyltransferase substrate binding protein [Deltaproteobacteria bacterium]|nr:nucleotidyltransferase substrate binding protein [Deltaproteobacteria bacterium]
MKKPLILTPLERALTSLNRALERAQKALDDEELRDACIQRFEYTFELCWKLLKRQLVREIENEDEVAAYSRRTLFRVGGERGLLSDVSAWFIYLDKRNITSHTYDQKKADEVRAIIDQFAIDAGNLLEKLKARNA